MLHFKKFVRLAIKFRRKTLLEECLANFLAQERESASQEVAAVAISI